MTNEKIKEIYNDLNKKIIFSDSYKDFIIKMSENIEDIKSSDGTSFKDMFTFEGKFDADIMRKAFTNLEVMKRVCSILNIDKEFYESITKGCQTNDIIRNICNTHFLNIKYGNPNNQDKEDYSLNDRLFYIIETIFGLDVIIESYKKDSILGERLSYIMQNYDGSEYINLVQILNEMYIELRDEKDENVIKEKVREYKDALKPYIKTGIGAQINEVSNNDRKSFSTITRLEETVLGDILGYSLNKKM